ncbi:MAG: hypothetical protein ABIW76_15880 [Fibrobacteria bacterium]
MNTAIFLLTLTPMLSWAALCDDTYNLQSAIQTVFTGTNPKSLARSAPVSLQGDFSNLTVLHDQMAYSIVVGFEGSCTKAPKPVRIMNREASTNGFKAKTETSYQVVMYDTTNILQGARFDYWFGFYKPADTLRIALGRIKGEGPDFRGWYGYVAFEDSVRNPESGLWAAKGTQLRLAGPADSATLDSVLMVRTGFRDIVFDQNRHGHFKLQFIRLSFENKPGLAIRRKDLAAKGMAGAGDGAAYLADGKSIMLGKNPAFSDVRIYFSNRR